MINTDLENALKIMIGSQEAEAVYIGNSLIWNSIPYDTEIEYLESNGNQYIDSGIECTSNIKVHFIGSVQGTENAAACGGISSYTPYFRHHWSPTNNDFYWIMNNDTSSIKLSGFNINTWYDVTIDPITGNALINNEVKTFRALESYKTTGLNYFIFARKQGGGAIQSRPCRFKLFKIYDNNVLVRDFIPVRKGQIGYLYDRVSGLLFGNSGTGSFTLGPDKNPKEYITDGLIFHLDGINKGTGSDWTDLIGGILFTAFGNECISTENSWSFSGAANNYLIYTGNLDSIGGSHDFTIEVCYNEKNNSPHTYVFGLGHADNSLYPLYFNDGRYITWLLGDAVYDAEIMTGNAKYTISLNNDRGLVNGQQIEKAPFSDYWDSNSGNFRIGYAFSGGALPYPLHGDVYSIRIYNRRLSQNELLRNQMVDNLRFNLELTI